MFRQRVRIRFCKTGDLRFISHRDLIRAFERWFRRAGLKLSMTTGFHERPRMMFPSALAVGISGMNEVLEFELAEPYECSQLIEKLRSHAVPGLEIRNAETVPPLQKKPKAKRVTFEMDMPAARVADARAAIGRLLGRSSYRVERENGKKPMDIRPMVDQLSIQGQRLRMDLHVSPEGSARPREVLKAIDLDDLENDGFLLSRTDVEIL